MTPDLVRLLVVDGVSQAGACELCAGDGEPLTAAVVVQHMRGGEVRFAACARCARALHRVVGAIGDQGRFRPVEAIDAGPVTSVQTPASTTVEPAVAPLELILESPHSLRGPGRTSYSVRVYGQARPDGTWTGWLEFREVGGAIGRRTGQETSQSNREAVLYWATGLEPAYFEGAFVRAR